MKETNLLITFGVHRFSGALCLSRSVKP